MSTSSELNSNTTKSHYRFHLPIKHLDSLYGNNWFALKAESFARFFGTPLFLAGQTGLVIGWMLLNGMGIFKFDSYPFILLNLAFSLQAAYAAPLILLAQTRQSDRDKAHAEADARHREALAMDSKEQQIMLSQQNVQLLELMQQNTALTLLTKELSQRIEKLTLDVHSKLT